MKNKHYYNLSKPFPYWEDSGGGINTYNDGNGVITGAGTRDGLGYGGLPDCTYSSGYGNGNPCPMFYPTHGYGSGKSWHPGAGVDKGKSGAHGSLRNVMMQGSQVRFIDHLPTVILQAKGDVAKGFILLKDLSTVPCYIVRRDEVYAHGDTLHDAYRSLALKLDERQPAKKRIEKFIEQFPEYDSPYSNKDLFDWHQVLTGSCYFGRKAFCDSHNLSLSGRTSIRDFIRLAIKQYGGEIIKLLKKEYELQQKEIPHAENIS